MKKNLPILMLCLFIILAALAGCSKGNKNNNTPEAKETMIITTAVPSDAQPSPEPTAVPDPTPIRETDKYVNLTDGNEYVFYSASTTEAEHTADEKKAEYCFDNNPETRWSSEQFDVEESWICVSFGYPVKIGALDVQENKTWGNVGAWDVQYFDEEKDKWITIYEGDGFLDEEHYITDEESPETYNVRLLFYDCTARAVTLNEIDIYGLFAEVPEGTEPRSYETPVEKIDREKITVSASYSASTTENEGLESALPASFTFDGNEETRWSSAFNDLDDGECWIQADFTESVTIGAVVVKEVVSWGHATAYEFQVMNGDKWETVFSGEEFSWGELIELDKPVSGTAFRFLFTEGTSSVGTITIAEIELYK